jgi:tripartite-type tricarboxylate transporter receptor subunit TctC
MPGAGGVAAANYLFKAAKPDGLTIGVWNPSLILRQALGDEGMRFESAKFRWIGSITRSTEVCAIMGFTGLKNWQQIHASKSPINMAATGPGAGSHYLPTLLRGGTGANFHVVTGYGGTSPILMALQRGEAHGACWNWESMRVIAKDILHANGVEKLIPFLIDRKPQDGELKDIQVFREVLGGEHLKMYEALTAHTEFFYPLIFPPGVPSDTLGILRRAFTAAVRDPKLIMEASAAGITLESTKGEAIEALIPKITDPAENVRKNLRLLLGLNR